MVENIFAVITASITSFSSALATAVTSISAMFYDPTAAGGVGAVTFIGVLLLIGIGVAVVYWVFNMIRSLVQTA